MDEKLKRLGENNIKGLVLDLRENPGRPAERRRRGGRTFPEEGRGGGFAARPRIGREDLLGSRQLARPELSHRGGGEPVTRLRRPRSSPARCRIMTAPGFWAKPRSARAWSRRFFRSSENTGLALTTAHYYTPSGRLIQRDYSNISFLDYYYGTAHRHQEPAGREDAPTAAARSTAAAASRRTRSTLRPSTTSSRSTCCASSPSSTSRPSVSARARMPSCPKAGSRTTAWSTNSTTICKKQNVPFTEADFDRQPRLDQAAAEARNVHHRVQLRGIAKSRDRDRIPKWHKAIDALPKAQALVDNAKKLMVQRIEPQDRRRQLRSSPVLKITLHPRLPSSTRADSTAI